MADNNQHMLANHSHVRYEFTNTKKLVKKLARIEASCICHQQFANMFADCFCAVHTHQLDFANTSLPCEGRSKLWQGNHVIIVTSSFSKSLVFKMFSVHTKTQSRRFRIPPVGRAF